MTYVPYNQNQNFFANANTFLRGRTATTTTLTSSAKWILDRWLAYDEGNGNVAVYTTALTPLPTNENSSQVSSVTWKTGATHLVFGQRFYAKDARVFKNKVWTVSFLARASTGTIVAPYIEVRTPTVADNWASLNAAAVNVQTNSAINATGFVECQATFILRSITGIDNGIQIAIRFPSGTMVNNQIVYITQVVLNEGPIASEFSLAGQTQDDENIYVGAVSDTNGLGYTPLFNQSSGILKLNGGTSGFELVNTGGTTFFSYDSSSNFTFTGTGNFTVSSVGNYTFGTGVAHLYSFNSTNAILLPKGTDAERPGTPAAGHLRYNTTSSVYEVYNATIPDWDILASRRFATSEAIKYSIVFS